MVEYLLKDLIPGALESCKPLFLVGLHCYTQDIEVRGVTCQQKNAGVAIMITVRDALHRLRETPVAGHLLALHGDGSGILAARFALSRGERGCGRSSRFYFDPRARHPFFASGFFCTRLFPESTNGQLGCYHKQGITPRTKTRGDTRNALFKYVGIGCRSSSGNCGFLSGNGQRRTRGRAVRLLSRYLQKHQAAR